MHRSKKENRHIPNHMKLLDFNRVE